MIFEGNIKFVKIWLILGIFILCVTERCFRLLRLHNGDECNECICSGGGLLLTWMNYTTWRKISASGNSCATNRTWTALEMNPSLHCEISASSWLMHGKIQYISFICLCNIQLATRNLGLILSEPRFIKVTITYLPCAPAERQKSHVFSNRARNRPCSFASKQICSTLRCVSRKARVVSDE